MFIRLVMFSLFRNISTQTVARRSVCVALVLSLECNYGECLEFVKDLMETNSRFGILLVN
jgi:hypothetical protein